MTDMLLGFGYGLVVAFAVNAWWMLIFRKLEISSRKSIGEAHRLGRSGRDLDGKLLPAESFTANDGRQERLGEE